MQQQYVLKNGILKLEKISKRNPFWTFLLVLMLMGASGSGAFFYAKDKFSPPKDSHIVSNAQMERFLSLENALNVALQKEIQRKDYVVDSATLKIIMDKFFPKEGMSDKDKDAYIAAAAKWGAHYAIPPMLILSIAYRESLFEADVVSSANARGPMQVIYKYHKDRLDKIGKTEKDLHDIDTGIRIGTEVFRAFYDHHKEDIYKAMKSYVGGSYRSYAEDILNRYFQARIFLEKQMK